MIEVRELDKSEYEKLASIAEGYIPPPEFSVAMIADDNGEIVGRMFLVCPAHLEGTWISPRARKGITGKLLIGAVEAKGRQLGLSKYFAYARDNEIEGYLKRLGFKRENLTVWSKELDPCHSH